MPTIDEGCLSSTLRNTSGVRKKFSFIPPHGKELDVAEEITVPGDIREAVRRGDRYGERHYNGLVRSLAADEIEILSTPAPVLYDETDEVNKILVLDDGALGVADPCWELSLSDGEFVPHE